MIGAALRRTVRERADHRCEYCGMRQDHEPLISYQIEHVIAIQHGGGDESNNLALACTHCNLHKGPNLSGIDPETGTVVALFHPRLNVWSEHFRTNGAEIVGLTPCGRATVRVLDMNSRARLDLRLAIQLTADDAI